MTQQVFDEIKVDFYRYLVSEGGLQKKTSHDYISRLSFLARKYCIDESLTDDKIAAILVEEEQERSHREIYNTKHAIGDFQACLRKVVAFAKAKYRDRKREEVMEKVKAIESDPQINPTEKEQIIQARIGQGKFRRNLIEYWHGCAVSGCTMTSLMIASHIKPWRDANNLERLDFYNGLLLLPNYDKLFDMGLMTFDTTGKAVFSTLIDPLDLSKMGIDKDCHLQHVEEKHKPYLEYHNNACFIG